MPVIVGRPNDFASARQRLTGGMKQNDYDDLRASLQQMTQDLPVLKHRCDTAQSIYKKCRQWLDDLSDGTVLETVEVKVDSHDLSSVRAKIKTAEDELKVLRSMPTASTDIETKIRSYVEFTTSPVLLFQTS
jgi:hypothetical protein